MKIRFFLFVIICCLSAKFVFGSGGPTRRCIFSSEVANLPGGLSTGSVTVGDGIFIFESSKGLVTAERHAQGKATVLSTGKAYTNKIKALFKDTALDKFDFEKAMAEARNLRGTPKSATTEVWVGATKYRVRADFEGTNFSFECEHLGSELRELSNYSAELKRLQKLLDAFEISY